MIFCEGEERFGGVFRDEGQVDLFSREGPLVGAAEQQQCFGDVDRSRVDGMQAVDEFAVVAVRIVAGHLEKCLRDRQRGRQVSGSVAAFVAEMNHTAHSLGMSHTTYTDPSGYDAGTISTALDQLRLARLAAKDETLAALMATGSYSLPVAGDVTNTDTLLGHDGFVGMKTGSDGAAGGCFMFMSERRTDSGNVALIGVVLGQRGQNLITAALYAAKQLVDRLAPNAATP